MIIVFMTALFLLWLSAWLTTFEALMIMLVLGICI